MSIFSKIGKGLKKIVKKVLPFAPLAALIPVVGSAISAGASAIGGLFSGKQADESQNANTIPIENNTPTVQVEAQKTPTNWMNSIVPIATGALNYVGQKETNAANAQQAQKQMDFQAEQTGTSYQRGVADMKAAGLNPMLAYSQGGASSGSGAMATMGNEVGQGANSALSAKQTMQELENLTLTGDQIAAQTELLQEQQKNTKADTLDKLVRPGLTTASTNESGYRTRKIEEETQAAYLQNLLAQETMDSQIKLASSAADLRRYEAAGSQYGLAEKRSRSGFWGSGVGKAYPYVEAAGDTANSAASALGRIFKGR